MPGISNVAVLVRSTVRPLELAIYCEIFGPGRAGIGRAGIGGLSFDFAVVSERPGVGVQAPGGLCVTPAGGLDRLGHADLIAIAPPVTPEHEISADVAGALRAAVGRGARIVAVCSAAFTLAAAGLLDGRRVATHRMYAAELARRHPRARVTPDVRYVDDDPIFTCAGATAAIDVCLHVIRKEHGAAAAAALAGRLALASTRPAASPASLVVAPVPRCRAQPVRVTGRRR
jgi:transcriptional regulator GlxA family with amidase domain